MNSRHRTPGLLALAAAVAVTVSACGGSTVEGEAPELSAGATTEQTSTSAFAEERPERPTTPIPPPPSPEPSPEPAPSEPAPEPPPGEPAPGEPAPPVPPPGAGDFSGVLAQGGVVLPEGMDPAATATDACGRFDQGQTMVEVSDWLGGHARLDAERQGFFLGAAVGTFCPHNFPKLG